MTSINLTVVVKEDLTLEEVKSLVGELKWDLTVVEATPVEVFLTVDGRRVEI